MVGGGISGPVPAPITNVQHLESVVAGGAVGWVTTIDVVTAFGLPQNCHAAFFMVYASANQDAGVRGLGETVDCQHSVAGSVPSFAGCAKIQNNTVQLYRAGTNNAYYVVGYIT